MSGYHNLDEVRALIRQGDYHIAKKARVLASAFDFDETSICDCIVTYLNDTHFYKWAPSWEFPELWQDVYRITYHEVRVYLKSQIMRTEGKKVAVVISFQPDIG